MTGNMEFRLGRFSFEDQVKDDRSKESETEKSLGGSEVQIFFHGDREGDGTPVSKLAFAAVISSLCVSVLAVGPPLLPSSSLKFKYTRTDD
jgi:hypothetical protein